MGGCHSSLLSYIAHEDSPIMSLLQGGNALAGCNDHCKYEGSAIWQYDPSCTNCGGNTFASLCDDHCKWEGAAVWQYDPTCRDCHAVLPQFSVGNSPIMSLLQSGKVSSGCDDYCKYEGSAIWQYDPNCKNCR